MTIEEFLETLVARRDALPKDNSEWKRLDDKISEIRIETRING